MTVMTRNVQLVIAYDGTDFHGWQTQPGVRTVQGEVEDVLRHVVRHPVELIASGRTDAGVHAAGQVANFHTDCSLAPNKLLHAIGGRFAEDVSLLRVRDGPPSFHATLSALSKLYRYRICNTPREPEPREGRYTYHYYRPLAVDPMREAARCAIGTHNFRALTSTRGAEKASYVRTVLDCDVYTALGEIRIDVRGTGFLYNQVRNMVGTFIEIGRGHWAAERIHEILASQDRQQAGPTAPARGLCLQWVQYPPDHQIDELRSPAPA